MIADMKKKGMEDKLLILYYPYADLGLVAF